MNRDEKKKFIEKCGWETWYHPNYWVHPKTIKDPQSQDYTNYGMSLEKSYEWEIKKKKALGRQLPLELFWKGV